MTLLIDFLKTSEQPPPPTKTLQVHYCEEFNLGDYPNLQLLTFLLLRWVFCIFPNVMKNSCRVLEISRTVIGPC